MSSALLDRIGGAIPTVFSYFAEVLAREKRGEHLSWLCMFWMIGGIYASAMAWAIIPHYGKVTFLSICFLSVLSSGLGAVLPFVTLGRWKGLCTVRLSHGSLCIWMTVRLLCYPCTVLSDHPITAFPLVGTPSV